MNDRCLIKCLSEIVFRRLSVTTKICSKDEYKGRRSVSPAGEYDPRKKLIELYDATLPIFLHEIGHAILHIFRCLPWRKNNYLTHEAACIVFSTLFFTKTLKQAVKNAKRSWYGEANDNDYDYYLKYYKLPKYNDVDWKRVEKIVAKMRKPRVYREIKKFLKKHAATNPLP
jgi:hypothetical protein